MLHLLAWIVLGLLAGWIAGMIMGGRGYGILRDIILGIAGALIGGFLTTMFLGVPVTGLNVISLIIAVIGAILLIVIIRLVTHRRVWGR